MERGSPTFYCHGLHGMWWTHKITGGGIKAVSQKMDNWAKGGGVSTVIHKDRGKGEYTGTIHHTKRENCLIWTKFAGSDQVYRYDTGYWENFVYLPLLLAVQDMFWSGMEKLPETYDSFLEKSRFYLAAFRSHLREKGGMVELERLDEDWSVGCPGATRPCRRGRSTTPIRSSSAREGRDQAAGMSLHRIVSCP